MSSSSITIEVANNLAVQGLLVTDAQGQVEVQSGESLTEVHQGMEFFWHLGQLLGEDLGLTGLTQLQFTSPNTNLVYGRTANGRTYVLTVLPKTEVKPITDQLLNQS
jgi:hypothetical protein